MPMELADSVLVAISVLGFITVSKTLVSLAKWVWFMFLRPPKNLKDYGSWAVVTGSTDGIGKALVFELASSGLNLVLVGRNPLKLEAVSREIKEKYGDQLEIKNIVIDLNKVEGEEIARTMEKGIKGLDVGVLINNAGLSNRYAKYFHEIEVELMESIIKVNVEGVNWITRAVLPEMLKKKKGAIVNIGSGSSVAASSYPLFAIYVATKAYIAMFSKCLSLEYRQQGIDIQCQIPLLVATKMTSIKRSSFFVPSPKQFSRASIRWIGYQHMCVPYWTHSVQWCLTNAMPDALFDWCILSYFLGVRRRGLAKERLAKDKNP